MNVASRPPWAGTRGSDRPGETKDAEKETESGGFLKSRSGESLTLRRAKGKSRSL